MKRYNLVYLVSTLKQSGPTRILYSTIKNLDFNRFNVTVITFSPETENSMILTFEKLPLKIEQINLGRIKGLFFLQKYVEKILSELKADIIHSHGFRPDIINSSIRGKYKKVTTLHNYPYQDYTAKYGKTVGYIASFLHFYFIRGISNKVACSKSLYDIFKKNKNMEGLTYIQNGVEPPKHTEYVRREDLNIPKDAKIIIYSGSLIKRKNPLLVIDAFIKTENKNIYLLVLGEGPYLTEIQKKSQANSNIIVLGFKKNVYDYLEVSNYFISSSFSEGLPNSVMEAMSVGLLPILSRIPQHKELLSDDYFSKFFFNPLSEEELIKSIKEAILEDKVNYSEVCKRIIMENFTGDIMSKKYQTLYLS